MGQPGMQYQGGMQQSQQPAMPQMEYGQQYQGGMQQPMNQQSDAKAQPNPPRSPLPWSATIWACPPSCAGPPASKDAQVAPPSQPEAGPF